MCSAARKASAWIVSVGKIFPVARGLKNEGNKLHLVQIPFEKSLRDVYQPSWLTSEEYPNLIPAGQEVPTLSASVILATYNWPEKNERYKKVARFTEAFFSKSAEFLKPPRNPKWQDMNLSENVLGWTRFKAAQEWLERNPPKNAEGATAAAGTPEDFKQFLREHGYGRDANIPQEEIVRLFKAYNESLQNKK